MTIAERALLLTTGKFLLNTKGAPLPLSPTAGIVKHIVADYGATFSTVTPDPANAVGGSRFYGLQGQPGFAVARMNFTNDQVTFNFGGTAFAQSVPSGFSAWGAATVLSVQHGAVTLSGGNLTATTTSGASDTVVQSTTSHSSGKWYFEATVTTVTASGPDIGIWNLITPLTDSVSGTIALGGNSIMSQATDGGVYFGLDGGHVYSGTLATLHAPDIRDRLDAPFTSGDVISVAINFDTSRIWFRRNAGAWCCLGTSQAFEEFKFFGQQQTQQVLLFMDPGSYRLISFDSERPFAGIPKIAVWGYGATFSMPGGNDAIELGSHSGYWGGGNFPYPSGPVGETLAVRLNPVKPGDKWVDPVYPVRTTLNLSLFPPGAWCSLDSQELQGHGGFPPNEYNCEYVQISGVQGARIFLMSPVKGTYVQGLPDRYHNVSDGYDPGGPATLHRMFKSGGITPDNAWDSEQNLFGFTYDQTGGPGTTGTNTGARSVIFTDIVFVNSFPNVTVSKSFKMIRGQCDGFTEIDKDCEQVSFDTVKFNFGVLVQSASIQNATFNNCTWAAGKVLQGSSKAFTANNCTIPGGIVVGAVGYGQTKSYTMSNSTVSSVGYSTNFVPLSQLTYSNGVFNSAPMGSDAVINAAVPGPAYYGGSGRPFALGFKVLSVTADANNNTVITTDLPYASALPTLDPSFATPWLIWQPAAAMFVSNCTGCPEIIELGDAYPQGKPLFCYMHRTFTGHTPSASNPNVPLGTLVSISINVTTPYSGPLSAPVFNFGSLVLVGTNYSAFVNLQININIKIAGERIITPNSVTGLQSGDSISGVALPTAFTFGQGSNWTQDLTGDTGNPTPTTVLTVKANQLSQFS